MAKKKMMSKNKEDFSESKWSALSVGILLMITVIIFFFIPVQPITLLEGIDYSDPQNYVSIVIMIIFIVFVPLSILFAYFMIKKKRK